MLQMKHQMSVCALAMAGALAWGGFAAHADGRDDDRRDDQRVKKVFVIAMENHNWTQPSTQTSPQAIFRNPSTPFINSLVNGTSGISREVAYATNYLNAGPGIHPSEPNYIWAEAGTNFGVLNDDQPYHADCSPDTVQTTSQHLSAFLTTARKTWRSYQEDTDVDSSNVPLARSQWTVPLFNLSGLFTGGFNAFNYSKQYNYAAKHNPMVYFTDTNGGCDTTTSNPKRLQYAPLQQLTLDLQNDRVADYNWISPDQFNDQHTALTGGWGYQTGDSAQLLQGDNFLSRIVPLIMASDAYKDHGVIVLWWDESEGGDDPSRTLPFIIVSKDAHENVGGVPYASSIDYSHSSFLRTMQEIFHVDPRRGYPWLGGASTAFDLSDLFERRSIE